MKRKIKRLKGIWRANKQLSDLTKQNRDKLDHEHNLRMKELMDKLQRKEKQLDDLKKEKYSQERKINETTNRIEKVKKEREVNYQNKKENMLIKLHHKEEILKTREKEKQLRVEILKEINKFKQQRKDIYKENHRQMMEMRRQEFLDKLKVEQEKAEAYAKQREMVLEQKYTNQMIDQMKVHYWKELYYNMKIQNKVG